VYRSLTNRCVPARRRPRVGEFLRRQSGPRSTWGPTMTPSVDLPSRTVEEIVRQAERPDFDRWAETAGRLAWLLAERGDDAGAVALRQHTVYMRGMCVAGRGYDDQ
jgi:hypothetical protein